VSAGLPTLAIGGPTATGKTRLAVELALRLGAEIVNADARQVVRRLRVGTAAPTAAELRGVACHLLDQCEPGEPFTVADWLERARAALTGLDARGIRAIVVGGTGQYLRALREGWDLGRVSPDPVIREELTTAASTGAGRARLVAELRRRDPGGAAELDVNNPRRVVRALELLRAGEGSLAELRRRSGGRVLTLVVLDADRAVHEAALGGRMEAMFGSGAIITEVGDELARGTSPGALARAGIGYAEALAVIERGASPDEARAAALARTRRYVKAQRTWFRHEPATLRLERGSGRGSTDLATAALEALEARSVAPPR